MQKKLSAPQVPKPESAPPESAPVIDPSQILTLDEIASRLKTSRRWVYEKSRRRCLDPLPVVRIGRYLRFYWPDVSTWLRKNSSVGAA